EIQQNSAVDTIPLVTFFIVMLVLLGNCCCSAFTGRPQFLVLIAEILQLKINYTQSTYSRKQILYPNLDKMGQAPDDFILLYALVDI
ncbi:MAG: hypothetical protein WBO58_08865, partial [Gammaproteobacteria bacterium]